jgi:hypothetical protein
MTSTRVPCDTWSPEERFTRGTDIIIATSHAPTTVPEDGLLSRAPSTLGEVCQQWIDRCRTDPASAAHRRQWLLAGSRDHPDPATSVDHLLTALGIPIVPTVTYVSTLPSRRQRIDDVLCDTFCRWRVSAATCHITERFFTSQSAASISRLRGSWKVCAFFCAAVSQRAWEQTVNADLGR